MNDLPLREIDGHGIIRRLGASPVARRVILDPQLRIRDDDPKIAVILIIVVLQDDLIAMPVNVERTRRPDRAVLLPEPCEPVPSIPGNDVGNLCLAAQPRETLVVVSVRGE